MAQLATFGYVLAALLMLGVLITVHELGHFLVARACGMAVCEFSIGMGPKIFSRKSKKSDTLYSLRAFPLGGFCLFYGEDEEMDDPRAYNRQSVWKRFLSVLAGPAMNFVVAILLFVLVFSGFALWWTTTTVDAVSEHSPAALAGLQAGDQLLRIDGQPVRDSEQFRQAVNQKAGQPVTVTARRGEVEQTYQITPRYDAELDSYLIGFNFGAEKTRLPLSRAVPEAFRQSVDAVKALYDALRNMIFKGEGVEDLSGPIGTINIIQQETRENGIEIYLLLAAMISINLGFMNLLPIPGLDGSRLVFFTVEAIRRKPIDRNIEGGIHFAGFVLLVGLMIVFTYKDIVKLITG